MYEEIQHIACLASLATLTNVAPRPRVNALFSSLVAQVVRDPGLHERRGSSWFKDRIRTVCADGETAMEHAWAKRILSAEDPRAELAQFPYTANYERLAAREWQLVLRHCPQAQHVVFLGSGPLPLTGMVLAEKYGCRVTLVDQDAAAVEASQKLIARLGIQNLRVVQASAQEYGELASADVVYVAALVSGVGSIQKKLYGHLAKTLAPQAVALVRSAHASRTLMYHPIDNTIDKYFERLAEMHPHDDVINSSILMRAYV